MGVIKRRIYTEQFRTEALKLTEDVGITKAAKDLGINPVNIRRWQKSFQNISSNASSSRNLNDLEKEVLKLKKELRYVYEINEVLKKSVGIFVKEKSPSR